jgi:hypothetical protein
MFRPSPTGKQGNVFLQVSNGLLEIRVSYVPGGSMSSPLGIGIREGGRFFRASLATIAAAFVMLASPALLGAQAKPARGTVIVPPSNVVPPQDRGKRAHTNFLIFVPASKGGKPAPNTSSAPGGETPSSLACVYQVGPTNNVSGCPAIDSGSSGTMNYDNPTGGSNIIAIVDAYDYPTAMNDFQVFSQTFGLPYGSAACGGGPCFTQRYANGTKPKANSSWAQEEALDIEWSHAMAPNAQIVLVEAASNSNANLLQAVNFANTYIADHGGKGEVSMSWGSNETSSEASSDSYFTQPGVTYFASSGDSGGKVIWPSASPSVISAGGTTVNRDSSGNFTNETTWSSAGGGPSSYEIMPTYQDITGDVNATGNRGTPDISFDANPATGVSVYDTTSSLGLSGWLVFGGTSVASPSLAGIINNSGAFDGGWDGGSNTASVSNNLYSNYSADVSSSTNPSGCSYKSATPFNDITSGSAGTYSSGGCWDFASGIGTLRGLNGPIASTGGGTTISVSSLTLYPTTVTGGSSSLGTSTGTVTLSATPTGSVSVSLSSNSSFASVPLSVTVSGSNSATFTVNTTTVTSTTSVTITANYNGSSANAQLVVNPPSTSGGSFTVGASNITVTPGSSGTSTVTIAPSGFSGSVTLSVTGLPKFATGSFSANPVSVSGTAVGTSILTISTNKHLAIGSYPLTITGTSGSQSSSITITLNVN